MNCAFFIAREGICNAPRSGLDCRNFFLGEFKVVPGPLYSLAKELTNRYGRKVKKRRKGQRKKDRGKKKNFVEKFFCVTP